MADEHQLEEVTPSPLMVKVTAEFFASVNRLAFEELARDILPDRRNMVIFLHNALERLPPVSPPPLKKSWEVRFDPSLEPSHPHWFTEGMFPLTILEDKRSLLSTS